MNPETSALLVVDLQNDTVGVVLAGDATATIADDWQHAALSYALTRIADVRTVDEIVAELGA